MGDIKANQPGNIYDEIELTGNRLQNNQRSGYGGGGPDISEAQSGKSDKAKVDERPVSK